ncbi:DUF4186 domain-containing protein [Pelobium sp.]|nr:DUF4186 family protein [Pelobium sp.]MDA9554649.1 DUF4186 domain-containing protein [Pelobium sp.]
MEDLQIEKADKKKKFKRVPAEIPITQITPLDITCGSTKCDDELHCFRMSNKDIKKQGKKGVCKECGADLVDWKRVHENNIEDAEYMFNMLKKELIRHVYWHTDIDPEAIKIAIKRGKVELATRARKLLSQKVGKSQNWNEGRQTPMMGNEIITYAQHATATCCRRCMEYWHDITPGTNLTEEQLDYCVELVIRFIDERVPFEIDEIK